MEEEKFRQTSDFDSRIWRTAQDLARPAQDLAPAGARGSTDSLDSTNDSTECLAMFRLLSLVLVQGPLVGWSFWSFGDLRANQSRVLNRPPAEGIGRSAQQYYMY